MNEVKVFIPWGSGDYASWIPNVSLVQDIYESDLVLFTGGEDVNPDLYGQKLGNRTHINKTRDELEREAFDIALKFNLKMLGVCRGSQFLCVGAGGELVQHMSHPSYHEIETWTGEKDIRIVSTHHQMQFPYRMPSSSYRVIAWANKLSDTYLNGDNAEITYQGKMLKFIDKFAEPEIVYYTDCDALAIQSHPEMMNISSPFVVYCRQLVEKLINNKLN